MFRILTVCVLCSAIAHAQPSWPSELILTPEKTNYEKTSTYADVILFLSAQSARSKDIRIMSMGKSPEGKDIPVAIVARPMVNSMAEAMASGKMIIYVQGNIHAGEVEGKEVVMMQIRELLNTSNRSSVLDKLIILFVPIYNTDSNDKMAFGRRPTQENSPPEVGIRENSQGLDLNRDGMKMEADETNALFKLINEWDPQIFVDLHTTNGSWHGWDLTWAPSYQYAGERGPYDFTVNMLKQISQKVSEKYNLRFGPFGDYYMNEGWPAKNFYTYNHHPRYLVNQFGLRNRMAILSEAFAHEPFNKRIYSTNAFVTSIIDFAAEHTDEIRLINRMAEKQAISQAGSLKSKGVRYKMVPSEIFNNMPSYDYQYDSATKRYKPTKNRTVLNNVNYYGGFEAEVSSTIPGGYVIPKQLKTIVYNLQKHGIKVEELKKTTRFSGDEFQVERYETAQRKFEGHTMARATGKFFSVTKKFKKGDFVVTLAQPLGNLAFYLLEPESDDGLVTWNFFDESIEKQKADNNPMVYPVFRYYKGK
ncbi:MAG TPA: M14 family metallopeptidase [Cyclobacteriaceae bacterium]